MQYILTDKPLITQPDYTIYKNAVLGWLCADINGQIVSNNSDATVTIQYALTNVPNFGIVFIKYDATAITLTTDLTITDKNNVLLVSRATLTPAAGHYTLIIGGTSYANNYRNKVSLQVDGNNRAGHAIKIQDGWNNKIFDSTLDDVNKAIVIASTIDWSEDTLLENINCPECTVFLSYEVSGTGTGGFKGTTLRDVQINLWDDGDKGIDLLSGATYQYHRTNLSHVSIWFHNINQRGLVLRGLAYGVALTDCYIESLGNYNGTIGIEEDDTIDHGSYCIIRNNPFVGSWGGVGQYKTRNNEGAGAAAWMLYQPTEKAFNEAEYD